MAKHLKRPVTRDGPDPDKCPQCRRMNVRSRREIKHGVWCVDCSRAAMGKYMDAWMSHALGDTDPMSAQRMIYETPDEAMGDTE